MACPAARLLPTAPREPRSRASRPAGAVRLFDPRTQAQHKGPAPAASPKRDEDFSSEKGDVSGRSRPSRSASPEEEEIPDDASELSEDFLRSLCQGADLEDVEALEIRVDSARQSLELLGQCLPNLKRLRLSESSILCVRELGSHLSKLQVLWLGRCGLQDLDGLTLLEGLRELYLPFNDVVDVAWPKWLDHLQVLDLEGNAVEDPDDLAELRKCYALRDLTIRGNPATFLPGFSRRTFFDQLPSLEFLDDLPNFPELPVQADLPCEEPFDGDAERFLDRYLACDLDLYMDLYLRQETPEAVKEGSWRQLLQAQEIQPRLADPERFGDEPGEEILILERLKAAPRGAVMSQPSLSVAAPPCAKSASAAEGFMLRPPPRGEAGSVLTRGGAMAGAPLAALRQRRGLHGASEDSEAALLVDLDIRELLRRYT